MIRAGPKKAGFSPQRADPMARILILTPQLPVPPQALTGMSQGTTHPQLQPDRRPGETASR